MGKAEHKVWELVDMVEQGKLRLPEMQRRYVWRSTRVRDLLDSLYRGYPSGAILLWETDEVVATRDFDVAQGINPYSTKLLLLDGQQRLTSLAAVIKGLPVQTRGKRPIEILFNLEHPDEPAFVTEVDDQSEDNTDSNIEEDNPNILEDATDSSEDELQRRFDSMTFVVSTKKLAQLPHWVKVTDVFKTESDTAFLKRAGVTDLDDPKCEKYTKRLAALRAMKNYIYRVDILEKILITQRSRKSLSALILWGPSCAVPIWPLRKLPPHGVTLLKLFWPSMKNAQNKNFLLISAYY